MSWQRLSRPAATFSCSTMALFTKPKRSCWPIILSPSSSRLTHPNSILLSGSGVTSKINWRVTCLPPWRNFLSRWLRLSLGIQPLTYAHLQRSLTSSRLLSQLMYTNHKETVLLKAERDVQKRQRLQALYLLASRQGKKPLASPEVVAALQERLHHPEGFRAYGEIQAYLAQAHGVSRAYSSVHALVRYRLGAKPKSPRRSHPKKTLTRSARSSPTYLLNWEPLQK